MFFIAVFLALAHVKQCFMRAKRTAGSIRARGKFSLENGKMWNSHLVLAQKHKSIWARTSLAMRNLSESQFKRRREEVSSKAMTKAFFRRH